MIGTIWSTIVNTRCKQSQIPQFLQIQGLITDSSGLIKSIRANNCGCSSSICPIIKLIRDLMGIYNQVWN